MIYVIKYCFLVISIGAVCLHSKNHDPTSSYIHYQRYVVGSSTITDGISILAFNSSTIFQTYLYP